MMIRKTLTNSKIDNMYLIYKIIKEEFDKKGTDELNKDYLFKVIMTNSRGQLNPLLVMKELDSLI